MGVARVYPSSYYPGARFRVVSDPIDFEPHVDTQSGERFIADLFWNGYETRVLRYDNTGEYALVFPPADADISIGTAYVMGSVRKTIDRAGGLLAASVRRGT